MNKFLLTIFSIILLTPFCRAELLRDEIPDEVLSKVAEPKVHTNYNYDNLIKIPLKLKVINEILSENEVYEGQEISFRVTKDVFHKRDLYLRKGGLAKAKVKVVITSGMNGIPASIILGDFTVEGLNNGQLSEDYEIVGQDRSLLVFPLKWALTLLPPTGSLTNFIKGGHAKLKHRDIVTIYYYPEWI